MSRYGSPELAMKSMLAVKDEKKRRKHLLVHCFLELFFIKELQDQEHQFPTQGRHCSLLIGCLALDNLRPLLKYYLHLSIFLHFSEPRAELPLPLSRLSRFP
jgi:hypothetical protein